MTTSIHTSEMLALILVAGKKGERKKKNLSICVLGERMNMPNSYIQKVEQGERRLDVVEYVWYCNILEVDPLIGVRLIQETILKIEVHR